VHVIGCGNHQYCAECKVARNSPATSKQSPKNKCNSSVLSAIDQSLAKQSKDDEDDFALTFNAAFDCDLDEFLALDRDSALAKFKSYFSNAREQAEVARSDHHRLTDELSAMRAKLNTVKLALADKDISNQPVTAYSKALIALLNIVNMNRKNIFFESIFIIRLIISLETFNFKGK
jgi:hypothetical protein